MHGFKIEIWLQFVFDPKCSAVKPCCSEHKVVVFVFFVKMPILHVKAFNNFCRAWSQLYHLLYFLFIYLNQALGARQVFIPLTECVVLSLNCVLSKIVENIKKNKQQKPPYQWEYCVHRLIESINKFVLHVLTGLIESPSQTSAWESTWWVRMTFWKTREEVQLTSVRMY